MKSTEGTIGRVSVIKKSPPMKVREEEESMDLSCSNMALDQLGVNAVEKTVDPVAAEENKAERQQHHHRVGISQPHNHHHPTKTPYDHHQQQQTLVRPDGIKPIVPRAHPDHHRNQQQKPSSPRPFRVPEPNTYPEWNRPNNPNSNFGSPVMQSKTTMVSPTNDNRQFVSPPLCHLPQPWNMVVVQHLLNGKSNAHPPVDGQQEITPKV